MVVIITCTDPRGLTGMFEEASKKFPSEVTRCIDTTLNTAKLYSQSVAPVYNPMKYPAFANYTRGKRVGGTLKATITTTPARRVAPGIFKGEFLSMVGYASWVNDGFMHHLSKRRIPGRHYMDAGWRIAEMFRLEWNLETMIQRTFAP